jgi:hypothetical protein
LLIPGDGLGEGYGMLGQAGSGRLRVSAAQNKLAAKVAKKYVLFCFHTVSRFALFCALSLDVKALTTRQLLSSAMQVF